MKQLSKLFAIVLVIGAVVFSSCGTSNAVRGGGIGAGAGAAVGAGIGAIIGGGQGAAWGAGIGALAGGTAGAIIGNRMDQQAKELEKIEGAQVEKVNDGQAIKVTFESGILFATGQATLSTASQAALTQFATSLQNNPDTDVKIYGHTDSNGGDRINVPLSQRRADAVKTFLEQRGIAGTRMTSEGVGSSQPVAAEDARGVQALNRRVEIYILPNAKMVREAEAQAQ